MLYLIEPTGSVYSCEISVGRALIRRDSEKKPLDTLRWQLVEEPLELSELLGVAFSHGFATGRGLVVDATFYATAVEPARLSMAAEAAQRIEDDLLVLPLRVSGPGYSERASQNRELSRDAAHDLEERRLAAEKARDEMLNVEPKEGLVTHWDTLFHETVSAEEDYA